MSKLYKPAELEAALGISRATLYNWIKSGKLEAERIGYRYLVSDEAMKKYGLK